MQITRNSLETARGPEDWFTGARVPRHGRRAGGRLTAAGVSVHFTPGARTAWHTHPNGQTIYVLEGIGRAQRRGGPIETIHPGDRVFFEPGEEHWHGAAPDRFMTHLALLDVDEDGSTATWGEHVTDDEYAAPKTTDVNDWRRGRKDDNPDMIGTRALVEDEAIATVVRLYIEGAASGDAAKLREAFHEHARSSDRSAGRATTSRPPR